MARGNQGQEIFLTDMGRRLFLTTLGEACEQNGWVVHAYVLMSNHYHLLLETPEANLVDGMKWFQGAYTQRFNALFRKRGHLFQGRYKALPIQTDPRDGGLEYFRHVSTYIHLNPFRAGLYGEGLSKKLHEYPWSSYPAFTGTCSSAPEWLNRSRVLSTSGLDQRQPDAFKTYRHKIERMMKFKNDPESGRQGEFEQQVKRGWFLGSDQFREKLLGKLDRIGTGDNYRGGQKREHNQAMAERYLKRALVELHLQEEDLLAMKANRLEKQAVAWLLKTHTTVTGVWLSDRLRLGHPSNSSRAIKTFREDQGRQVLEIKAKMTKCKG
jgi:REP element-mobilizing transposase RayT